MQTRMFGKSGLDVTALGFGASEIGAEDISDAQACDILNGLLDAGINLIDTASCYRQSEDKIGKAVAHRRDEFILTTKCGHAFDGAPAEAWTPELVAASIARSLRRLKTDHVDAVFLHSCQSEQLTDELIAALDQARQAGKVQMIGYSGDDDAAKKAVDMGVFDCIETSVSICDQQVLTKYLPAAAEAGLAVIAKRPLANVAWRYVDMPDDQVKRYALPYTQRLRAMAFTPADVGFDGDWTELALRFTAYRPGVSVAITGSTNLDHIKQNIACVQKGPLDEAVVAKIRRIWLAHDDGSWVGKA